MVQDYTPWPVWDAGVKAAEVEPVGVEGDGAGLPVEAVFVISAGGKKREEVEVEVGGGGGVVAEGCGFGRLEH